MLNLRNNLITLLLAGTIGFIAVGILVNIEEKKRNKLINKLEHTQKDEI